ncbi:aureobasidin A resistance protein, partial [human gut metagenome]
IIMNPKGERYENDSCCGRCDLRLHAGKVLTTIYAVMSRKRWYTVVLFACICLGIWWTAVYSGHHYIIDVMLGILTTIVGVLLMESKRIWARLKKNS